MKLQHVDFQGITFDLWNTLLVSEPGGVEVRQSFWQEVIDEMLPFMQNQYGNPSSIHAYGREVRSKMERVAKVFQSC